MPIPLAPEGRLPEDVRRWSGCGAHGPGATRSFGRPGHRPAPAVSGVCRCGRAGRGPVRRWVMATAGSRLRDRARKNGARLKTSRWSADRRPAFSKSNAGRVDGAEVQASVLVARIPKRCASRRSAPLTGARKRRRVTRHPGAPGGVALAVPGYLTSESGLAPPLARTAEAAPPVCSLSSDPERGRANAHTRSRESAPTDKYVPARVAPTRLTQRTIRAGRHDR